MQFVVFAQPVVGQAAPENALLHPGGTTRLYYSMAEAATSPWRSPRLAIVVGLLAIQMGVVGLLAYARLGDPAGMPDPLRGVAKKVGNSRVLLTEVPYDWVQLCEAWDSWLPFLQREAPRWLRTEGLLEPDDPLRSMLVELQEYAVELQPETLVPEAALEKRPGVLAKSPPPEVVKALNTPATKQRVAWSSRWLSILSVRLGTWSEWKRMHILLGIMQRRGFTRAEAALRPRLPPRSGDPDYNQRAGPEHTLRAFNDISLDDQGLFRLLRRWSELWRLAEGMRASGDPELQAVSERILDQLTDQPTLAEFADSLTIPLEEMRRSAQAAGLEIRPVTQNQETAGSLRVLVRIPTR